VPVLGYLDDLILVPCGIWLAIRLVPQGLMTEFRAEASRRAHRPLSNAAAFAVVGLWILGAALLIWAFWPSGVTGD
jgi:uncharacterized membrane protein YkvA (DUF1232 family)